MARVTNSVAAARRERVAPLWLQGVSVSGIAASLGVDWETVRRDIRVLATQATKELHVEQQLARLLLAGRGVEAAAWEGQQLALVLSAQKTQLGVLQVLQALDIARRVELLEQRLDALTGGAGATWEAGPGALVNGALGAQAATGRGGVP